MEELYIKHNSGEMKIFLNAAFPSTKAWFNQLLKVIELDSNRVELKNELASHFHRRISDCENLLPNFRNSYLDNMQKQVDAQRLVDIGKRPSGVPLSQDELKQAKSDLREHKRRVKDLLSVSKKLTREKEQFLRLLECL